MAGAVMRVSISFQDFTCTVADVTELRWWRRPVRYTAALYRYYWIHDDTNDYVSERVAYELERARRRALDPSLSRL